VVGAVTLAAAAIAVVLVASSLGSSETHPSSGLGGVSAPTLLQPTVTVHGVRRGPARSPPPFTPAPAAVRLADAMPLDRQIAQLFMVALPPGVTTSAAALGSTDWGGIALGSSNFGSDSQITALTAAIAGRAQRAGGRARFPTCRHSPSPRSEHPASPPLPARRRRWPGGGCGRLAST
jgi:hypothetical protein